MAMTSLSKTCDTLPHSPPLTPMLAQYLALKESHPDCLLFFRLGDFYELFFEDAKIASKALDITLTRRGKNGEHDVPMCGVPFHAAENYLARLIRQGHKVAICEQLETPQEALKNKTKGAKPIVRRDVVRIVTPGTLTEETLLDPHQNNYLGALYFQKNLFGAAWVDVSTGDFFLESLKEAELSSALCRMNPSEILLSEDLLRQASVILDPYKKIFSFLPSHRFDFQNGLKRLKEIFSVHSLEGFGSFSPVEVTSGGALLDYLLLTQKGQIPHFKPPKPILSSSVLEIDASTRRTLELTQTQQGQSLGSFFWAINRTVTPAGARLLAYRVHAPLKDVTTINERLDAIEWSLKHLEQTRKLRLLLKESPDLERILGRLALKRGGPRDMASLLTGLEKVHHIREILDTHEELPKVLASIFNGLNPLSDLRNLLSHALDQEASLPYLAREGGFIRSGYDQTLDEYRSLKHSGSAHIRTLEQKYISETSINSLKIKHNGILGFYIEINPNAQAKILDSFILRQTTASSLRYSTLELNQYQANLLTASSDALERELEIYETLLNAILKEKMFLSAIATALAELDVLLSLGSLAQEGNFTRPVIDNSLSFKVTDGRHWCVQESLKEETSQSFIANSCHCDADQRLWLLTGPNMAGKSTFLRQNALLVLLAQIGSYVPATSMKLGVVDKLFSRVGASDDLARGHSTFMIEMLETAAILNQATERSFVILDEIGRGTSTQDGYAIARSTLEYLHTQIKCRALFATHYHELSQLKGLLPHLYLAHMAIKEWHGSLTFLHKIQPGPADKSYGIHVAALAGLPALVLEQAQKYLNEGLTFSPLDSNKKEALFTVSHKSEHPKGRLSPLPLFESKPIPSPSLVEENLSKLDLDSLSPKEALDRLYQLKHLLKKDF